MDPDRDEAPMRPERSERAVKHLAGRIVSAIGALLALAGIVGIILGTGANITPGAVGVMLGVLGYFLGSRSFGTVTIVLSIAVLFFGLAASQGLIPGLDASDRTLPPVEPRAGN